MSASQPKPFETILGQPADRIYGVADKAAVDRMQVSKNAIYIAQKRAPGKGYPYKIFDEEGNASEVRHLTDDQYKKIQGKAAQFLAQILRQRRESGEISYVFKPLSDKIEKGSKAVYIEDKSSDSKGYPCQIVDEVGNASVLFYATQGTYNEVKNLIEKKEVKVISVFQKELNELKKLDDTDSEAVEKGIIEVRKFIQKYSNVSDADEEVKEAKRFGLRLYDCKLILSVKNDIQDFPRKLAEAENLEQITELKKELLEKIAEIQDKSIKEQLLKEIIDAVTQEETKREQQALLSLIREEVAFFSVKLETAESLDEIEALKTKLLEKVEKIQDKLIKDDLKQKIIKLTDNVYDKEVAKIVNPFKDKFNRAENLNQLGEYSNEFQDAIATVENGEVLARVLQIKNEMMSSNIKRLAVSNVEATLNETDKNIKPTSPGSKRDTSVEIDINSTREIECYIEKIEYELSQCGDETLKVKLLSLKEQANELLMCMKAPLNAVDKILKQQLSTGKGKCQICCLDEGFDKFRFSGKAIVVENKENSDGTYRCKLYQKKGRVQAVTHFNIPKKTYETIEKIMLVRNFDDRHKMLDKNNIEEVSSFLVDIELTRENHAEDKLFTRRLVSIKERAQLALNNIVQHSTENYTEKEKKEFPYHSLVREGEAEFIRVQFDHDKDKINVKETCRGKTILGVAIEIGSKSVVAALFEVFKDSLEMTQDEANKKIDEQNADSWLGNLQPREVKKQQDEDRRKKDEDIRKAEISQARKLFQEYLEAKNTVSEKIQILDRLLSVRTRLLSEQENLRIEEDAHRKNLSVQQDIINSETSSQKDKFFVYRAVASEAQELRRILNTVAINQDKLSANSIEIEAVKESCKPFLGQALEKKEGFFLNKTTKDLVLEDVYALKICPNEKELSDVKERWTIYLKRRNVENKAEGEFLDFIFLNSAGEEIKGEINLKLSGDSLEVCKKDAIEIFRQLKEKGVIIDQYIKHDMSLAVQNKQFEEWNEKTKPGNSVGNRNIMAEKTDLNEQIRGFEDNYSQIVENLKNKYEGEIKELLNEAEKIDAEYVDKFSNTAAKIEFLIAEIRHLEESENKIEDALKSVEIEKSAAFKASKQALQVETNRLKQMLNEQFAIKKYEETKIEHAAVADELRIANLGCETAKEEFNKDKSVEKLKQLIEKASHLTKIAEREGTLQYNLYIGNPAKNKTGAEIANLNILNANRNKGNEEIIRHLEHLKQYMETGLPAIRIFEEDVLNPTKFTEEGIDKLYETMHGLYAAENNIKDSCNALKQEGVEYDLKTLPDFREIPKNNKLAIALFLKAKYPGNEVAIAIAIIFEWDIKKLSEEKLSKVDEIIQTVYADYSGKPLSKLAARALAIIQYEQCDRLNTKINILKDEALGKERQSPLSERRVSAVIDGEQSLAKIVKDEEKLEELEEKAYKLQKVSGYLQNSEFKKHASDLIKADELKAFTGNSKRILNEIDTARRENLESKEQRVKNVILAIQTLDQESLPTLEAGVNELQALVGKKLYGKYSAGKLATVDGARKHIELAKAHLAVKNNITEASIQELCGLKQKAQVLAIDLNANALNPTYAHEIILAVNAELTRRLQSRIDSINSKIAELGKKSFNDNELSELEKIANELSVVASEVKGTDFSILVKDANATVDGARKHIELAKVHLAVKNNITEASIQELCELKQKAQVLAIDLNANALNSMYAQEIILAVNAELTRRLQSRIESINSKIVELGKRSFNDNELSELEKIANELSVVASEVKKSDSSIAVGNANAAVAKALKNVKLEREFIRLGNIKECGTQKLYTYRDSFAKEEEPIELCAERILKEVNDELKRKRDETLSKVDSKIGKLSKLVPCVQNENEQKRVIQKLEGMASELELHAKFDSESEKRIESITQALIIREHVEMERAVLNIDEYTADGLFELDNKAQNILAMQRNLSLFMKEMVTKAVGYLDENVFGFMFKAVVEKFRGSFSKNEEKEAIPPMVSSNEINSVQQSIYAQAHATKVIDAVKNERLRRLKLVNKGICGYMEDKLGVCNEKTLEEITSVEENLSKKNGDLDLTEQKIQACVQVIKPGMQCIDKKQRGVDPTAEEVRIAFKKTVTAVENKDVSDVLKQARGLWAQLKALLFGPTTTTGTKTLEGVNTALTQGKSAFEKTALGLGGMSFFGHRREVSNKPHGHTAAPTA